MPDSEAAVSTRASRRRWLLALVAVCVSMAALFWFFRLSNWSLRGILPDYVFTLILGIASVLAVFLVWRLRPRGCRRWFLAALLPGAAVGALLLVSLIPPLTLGTLFAASEAVGNSTIQRTVSSDGRWTVNVYFLPVGAYAGGNGRIQITASPRWLPVVEHQIYVLNGSHADETMHRYVRWTGPRSLEVVGEPDARPQYLRL